MKDKTKEKDYEEQNRRNTLKNYYKNRKKRQDYGRGYAKGKRKALKSIDITDITTPNTRWKALLEKMKKETYKEAIQKCIDILEDDHNSREDCLNKLKEQKK